MSWYDVIMSDSLLTTPFSTLDQSEATRSTCLSSHQLKICKQKNVLCSRSFVLHRLLVVLRSVACRYAAKFQFLLVKQRQRARNSYKKQTRDCSTVDSRGTVSVFNRSLVKAYPRVDPSCFPSVALENESIASVCRYSYSS